MSYRGRVGEVAWHLDPFINELLSVKMLRVGEVAWPLDPS